MKLSRKLIYTYLELVVADASAHEIAELPPVEVRAQAENLEGIAASGSEGVIFSQRLAAVPICRPAMLRNLRLSLTYRI